MSIKNEAFLSKNELCNEMIVDFVTYDYKKDAFYHCAIDCFLSMTWNESIYIYILFKLEAYF